MHAHARQWTLPVGFSRPERDADYFQGRFRALWPAVRDGRITHPDYQTLETALGILHEETRRLPRAPETWGLLHGDLHRGNFLLHEGEIRLIDFSMCAFGHFAYDLATCLSNVRQAFHPLFLENYTQFMPLPPEFERLLEGISWQARLPRCAVGDGRAGAGDAGAAGGVHRAGIRGAIQPR